MAEPYEILASPFEVWLAPDGTAFPDVDVDPSTSSPPGWELLGVNGADNQGDDSGVTVEHSQTFSTFRGGKSTGNIKAWRTAEELKIALTVFDVSAETYAKLLNDADVTDTPAGSGTPGTRSVPLRRGVVVATHALLVRSLNGSPYGDDLAMQYEVPRAYAAGTPAPAYRKNGPAGLLCEFMALEDLDAVSEDERFGRLVIQDAEAS
jgi:hypothetical protein